jgi:UDP-N-acetylglucosamine 1-carboxyvinyltransferase
MKNAVLPIMAAATVIDGVSELSNVPNISDVGALAAMIELLGGAIDRRGDRLSIDARSILKTELDDTLSKKMRASVLMTGPLLARLGSVTFPHPGGCVLGSRPIDVFVNGFKKLGAEYTETGESYTLSAPHGLRGGSVFFRLPSVTATETFMTAATLAKGTVTLYNAAMEPEVVAVADFLRAAGADIEGAGSPTITIRPSTLRAPSVSVSIIPDRIEAGSFMILGALAGNGVTVENVDPQHLSAVIDALETMGVPLDIGDRYITVHAPSHLRPYELKTHEHPGYPTDLQAPMGVLMTQAEGESAIIETIFDGRLNYTSDLVRMGADIQLWHPHKATVRGRTELKGREIDGPDIRAGLAFILAGIAAEGETRVGNAHLVDRGYGSIEERLQSLGTSIVRVTL